MKTRKSRLIEVYWINLERSKDRHANMTQLLKDPVFDGMKKTRIEAYDGGDPTTEKKMRNMIDMTDKATVKICFVISFKNYTYLFKKQF